MNYTTKKIGRVVYFIVVLTKFPEQMVKIKDKVKF